jgi:hypothetical protein
MTVIINEFEVVVDPPQPPAEAVEPPESEPAELSPEMIRRVFEYLVERRLRVLAD